MLIILSKAIIISMLSCSFAAELDKRILLRENLSKVLEIFPVFVRRMLQAWGRKYIFCVSVYIEIALEIRLVAKTYLGMSIFPNQVT